MMLTKYLEELTTTGSNSLQDLLRIAGIKPVSTRKADMVVALDRYLSDEGNIKAIWRSLTSLERELLEEFLRSEGNLSYDEIKEILKKYKVEIKNSYFRFSIIECFNERSKARLYFVNKSMPTPIYNILKSFVRPIEIVFTPLDTIEEDLEEYIYITVGESFEKDFVNVIKLVNSEKLKTTKVGGLVTKAGVLKINNVLYNKEIDSEEFSLNNVRSVEESIRIYGITRLLQVQKYILEREGMLIVGASAEEFLKSNIVERCRSIFNGYIYSSFINELERVRGQKLKTYQQPNLSACRKLLLEYLRKCPIDKWISMEQFLNIIKKTNKNFLNKVAGEIYCYDNYHREYLYRSDNWYEIEGRYIETVFIEYLSTIGIVDVVAMENYTDEWDELYWSVEYFKLTALGGYILGVSEDYKINTLGEDLGFIVQPNFEIYISEGSSKELHSLFFDKFAEKVSEGNISVYKLNFKAMVTAIDNGIDLEEIHKYIKQNCSNTIPENVDLTLLNWIKESKRIRIRTVTIVETDDVYLMEELKSYKTINNNILKDLPHAFEIEASSASKVKREIEKKNHFCLKEN